MAHPLEESDGNSSGPYTEEVVISGPEALLSPEAAQVPVAAQAQSYRRLVLLYELGREVFAETDEESVLQAILSAVSSLLNTERAFVAIVSHGKLEPRATCGIDLSGDMETWPVSTTMLNRVLSEGVSILTTDALHEEQYGLAQSVDFHNIRSVICCPLGKWREPTGLIYVDNRLRAGAFLRSDLEFLNALSQYAALAVDHAKERRRISAGKELAEARLDALREQLAKEHNIVGVSSQMVRLFSVAKTAANSDLPILIKGETGTGKEVLARFIHSSSPRAAGPFVPVHVAALPQTMIGSELFGHEKGAFTGAESKRIGRFELAHGGVLFLDEILDIPLDAQSTLLRVLEQCVFERLGSSESIEADVRIICVCNRDPEKLMVEGRFREDLYYRLNSITLEIPSLRERPEDIAPLVQYFLKGRKSDKLIDEEAMFCLERYAWPGNVRELRNCIWALDALIDRPVIRETDLPERIRSLTVAPAATASAFEPLSKVTARLEREHIARALDLAGGKNNEAIRLLDISRAKFFQRKKLYGL